MWQTLAAHGIQAFKSIDEIAARRQQLERALAELCVVISRETGDLSKGGLERARALRSKPASGGKSHYECINQLIHYWYCCASAHYLLNSGFGSLVMRPTGHDNATDLGDDERVPGPYDIEAAHPSRGKLVAEVFCVSEALWTQKMGKTREKLKESPAPIRAVFYNVDAKPTYQSKMERLIVYGVHAPNGEVREIAGKSARSKSPPNKSFERTRGR